MDINVNGTVNVFESVKLARKQSPDYDPVVVVACSSAQYGASLTPENVPITEDAAFMPLHPYGVSKVAQDLLSYQYFRSDGSEVSGPGSSILQDPEKANDVVADFTHRPGSLNWADCRRCGWVTCRQNGPSQMCVTSCRHWCCSVIRDTGRSIQHQRQQGLYHSRDHSAYRRGDRQGSGN